MLLATKGYFPLNICEKVWMCRLVLRLDPKLVSPSQKTLPKEILPSMVDKCLILYARPLLDATPIAMTTFDLWTNRK